LCLADRWDPAVIFLLRPSPGRTRPRCPCLRAGRAPAPRSSLGPARQGLPLPIKAAAACAALFFPNPSYPRRRPNLRTLAVPPAAPASCAPPPLWFVHPLRCSCWVRRGPCFALVPPASQIVPGRAGLTCAGEVAVERRRLRRVRRRPSAHRCSRPSIPRSVVQIAPSRRVKSKGYRSTDLFV
jgi:hypothetical protein